MAKRQIELCCGSADKPTKADRERHYRISTALCYINMAGVVMCIALIVACVAYMMTAKHFKFELWHSLILPFCMVFTMSMITIQENLPTRANRWDREFWKARRAVPQWKLDAARRFYGWDENADLSAIECEQCHIHGDCPLCGAE